jgi:hypothetical protein
MCRISLLFSFAKCSMSSYQLRAASERLSQLNLTMASRTAVLIFMCSCKTVVW